MSLLRSVFVTFIFDFSLLILLEFQKEHEGFHAAFKLRNRNDKSRVEL